MNSLTTGARIVLFLTAPRFPPVYLFLGVTDCWPDSPSPRTCHTIGSFRQTLTGVS